MKLKRVFTRQIHNGLLNWVKPASQTKMQTAKKDLCAWPATFPKSHTHCYGMRSYSCMRQGIKIGNYGVQAQEKILISAVNTRASSIWALFNRQKFRV